MNGIGIDLCPSTCRVTIKEIVANERCYHHVSDGVRRSIPVAAGADGAWGSAAAIAEHDTTVASPADRSAFWRGLRHRVVVHLGGLQPTLIDDYDVTVACEEASDGARGEVERALHAAGWPAHRVVAPVDAVLVAWLRTRPTRLPPGAIVAAVCCGETLTEIRAYKLAGLRPASASDIVVVPDCGHAPWRDHLRAGLDARIDQPPLPIALRVAVDDSIVEMARALSRVAPTAEIAWRGAAAGRLNHPLVLSPIEAGAWPAVAALQTSLPEALRAAAAALDAPWPAAVALGGIGSVWPFSRDVLVANGLEPWQAKDPLDAVAIGAAAWNDGGPLLGSLPAPRAPRALIGSE